jgi:hypothetical protein
VVLEVAFVTERSPSVSFVSPASFVLNGGSEHQPPRLTVVGDLGSDVNDPAARTILSLMASASSMRVTARFNDGGEISQVVPLNGAAIALKNSWCR